MRRFTPSLSQFQRQITTPIVGVLSKTPRQSSWTPHSDEHIQAILNHLKQDHPNTEFKATEVPAGTVLKGNDVSYLVSETMPLREPHTPLSKLPESIQTGINRIKTFFGPAMEQTFQVTADTTAVTDSNNTVYFVHPKQLSLVSDKLTPTVAEQQSNLVGADGMIP